MNRFIFGAALAAICFTGIAAYTYTYNYDVMFVRRALSVGATTSSAKATIVNDTAAQPALILKGVSGQSANIFDVQNSSGTSLWAVGSAGAVAQTTKFSLGTTNASTSTMSLLALDRAAVDQAYMFRFDDGGSSSTATAGKMICKSADCTDIKNLALFLNVAHPSSADIDGDSRDAAFKVSYNNHGQNSTSTFIARGAEYDITNRAAGTVAELVGENLEVKNIATGTASTMKGIAVNIEQGGTTATAIYGLDIELETSVAKPTTMAGILVRNTGTFADAADAAFKVSDTGANTGFTYGADFNGATIGTADIRLENAATIANAAANVITTNAAIQCTNTSAASIPCPVMTYSQMVALGSPGAGMCVFCSTTSNLRVYDGSSWQAAW